MCVLRKGALFVGLLSLVALSAAKLRWKCELFDTSQESSTQTTFVEFINNKPPQPNNARITRSTSSKCRPRPKNGTVGPSTESEKLRIETKRKRAQLDAPGNSSPGDTDVPQKKYQRKTTHQSTDLNIGPGFEESNDPYARNNEPVPRRFRPAELKGADELAKPLTEQLDENVMPDFEFDGDEEPPVAEDLPWCPEEPEQRDDCETADLSKLSPTELIELKQECEKTATPERLELIDKLIRTENNHPMEGVVPTTDRTVVLPPTGAANCTENPSSLSNSTLEKYRKECPCEGDPSTMSEEELEKFKEDCLEPIEESGEPRKLVRKNGRCAASQKKTDAMSEEEYDLFVKECLVGPKNVTLKKILVIKEGPECSELDKLSKKEFSDYRKKCVKTENCDDVDEKLLKGKKLEQFKKMCSSKVRKTNDICQEKNVDELDDEQFETYKKTCIFDRFDRCSSVDVDSLSDKEYMKYKEECLKSRYDCGKVNPKELNDEEYEEYWKECLRSTENSPPRVRHSCEGVNVEELSRKEYFDHKNKCLPNKTVECHSEAKREMNEHQFAQFSRDCSNQHFCDIKITPLTIEKHEKFRKECRATEKFCAETSPETPEDEEFYEWQCAPRFNPECKRMNRKELSETESEFYEKNCTTSTVGIDCLSVNPKTLNRDARRRFEKKCVKDTSDCKQVDFEGMSEKEYSKYQSECVKDIECPKIRPRVLDDEELRTYQQLCLFDCDVNPKKLSKRRFKQFQRKCVKESSDCRDVEVSKLSEKQLERFRRECVKESNPKRAHCADVNIRKLTEKEYVEFKRICIDEDDKPNCATTAPRKLSPKQFRAFAKNCVREEAECQDVNVEELSDAEYAEFTRHCLRDKDCDGVDAHELSDEEYATYKKNCLEANETDCEAVKPRELSKKRYEEYVEECVKDNIECNTVNAKELSEEEYAKFARRCLTEKFNRNCSTVRREDLSVRQYKKYRRECLEEEEEVDCGHLKLERLTRKQYKRYEKRCLRKKTSPDCDDVDVDQLNDEEYEKYKRNCLRKDTEDVDCESVEIESLSKKELKRYEKACVERKASADCDNVNPDDLSDDEYEKYKRDCLRKKKRFNCKNVDVDQLNAKEYAEYKRDCLDASDSCKTVNVEELSRKQYRKYRKECLSRDRPSPGCEDVDVEELSDEEFSAYKKKCSGSVPGDNVEITKKVVINKPETGVSPDCLDRNTDGMSETELAEHQEKCSKGSTVELIKKVVVDKGNGTDDCKGVDVEKLTPHEYNVYKKHCKATFEGEDCDEIRVDKLSEQKLREYTEQCGVFCGIDRPDALNERQRKMFEKKCEGDEEELEKDCKQIDVEKLGERQLGDYAEKCVDDRINACSMLKSRRLVRKVYNQYVLRCKSRIQPSESVNCSKSTEGMTLEEYKEHTEKCGKKDECAELDVDKIDLTQYVDIEHKCPVNTSTEGCEDVEDHLNLEDYQRLAKKCGTREWAEECDARRERHLDQKAFARFVALCGDPTDDSIAGCKGVDVEGLSTSEFEEFKEKCVKPSKERKSPPGGSNPPGELDECSSVDVDELTEKEYKEYKRKCSTRKTPKTGPDDSDDCSSVNVNELSDEEYGDFKRRCGKKGSHEKSVTVEKRVVVKKKPEDGSSTPDVPENPERPFDCDDVDIESLTKKEYKKYKKECGSTRKTSSPDCDDVNVDDLSDEEYRVYKKKCGRKNSPSAPGDSVTVEKTVIVNKPPRDGTPDVSMPERPKKCEKVNTELLTKEEFEQYQKECGSARRPEEDCSTVKIEELTADEYVAHKKRCMNPEEPSVSVEKTVVVNKKPDDCYSVDVFSLSADEYKEHKKRCGAERKTPRPDCDDVDVNELSDEEYRVYKKKCGGKKKNIPDGPSRPEDSVSIKKTVVINKPPRDGSVPSDSQESSESPEKKPSVTVEKTVVVNKSPRDGSSTPDVSENTGRPFDCDDVDIESLTKKEYKKYKKECKKTRKTSNPDCEVVDIEKLSAEEYREFKKNCGVPEGSSPGKPSGCSDVNIEELSAEEFVEYKKRCGKKRPTGPQRPRGSPDSPESSESPESPDCSDVNVEELSAAEYAAYKRRCLRRRGSGGVDCSTVDVDSLSESEYRDYQRRCPEEPESVKVQKTVVINCQNKSAEECSMDARKPHVELTKIVKIVNGPSAVGHRDEYDCFDKDVNTLNDEEYKEFQKECGVFRHTFQPNCDSDVSKMSDEEFEKFRKMCGKKAPLDCETADVDKLTDEEYSTFLEKCSERDDCKHARVERMSASKYAEYRKKCLKPTTKSHDECADVKVEELSRKEYAAYKKKCSKESEPTEEVVPKERKTIDCSIVETSKMSKEEYADFKKHCAVRVTTDRFRPGENMILTKKVEIHTGKDAFSCYDRDVEKMSDEEYAEFEKRCLTHPHFRYDCSTVDTTHLSRKEYAEYQKECLKPTKSVVLTKKMIVNKTNVPVEDGCYNRNVDAMSDEEYAEYEGRCLGVTPSPIKKERKTSIDCHNVDLSKLSYSEIEEHLRLCRTRETASTPAPRRRQSLQCSDVNPDSLDEDAYAKWVRECLETAPKTIELEKKMIINTTTSLMTGGETVTVQKIEIRKAPHPDDDEGYLEGTEDFGVRVRTEVTKKIISERPDDDQESETGVILVKKVIHKIPRSRRPFDVDDGNDEGGVIEVKKLIMKTGRREPEGDDSEDVEEIVRRPRKKIGPKEEVVLLSVTKRHQHPYKQRKRVIEEEEPTEIDQLKKNTLNPDKVLREVRIRKHFGTGMPKEEAVVQEIGGPDFRIVRKTVMVPRRVRKLKPTTTTTTTPAEPEYYYDEEEVPEVITLVKTGQSTRPLRKSIRPLDEDEEYVDVREDQPKSYVEFEGFVKVHGAPRKIGKRPKFTDSGEEPEIREVTRKVVMQPGGEDDDLKGVKLRSHRKQLRRKTARPEEFPDDGEHEVTVVKKLKMLKFNDGEKETFDDDEDVEDDGAVVVRNRKRKFGVEKRPEDEEEVEEEEVVEGRVAVKGRAPRKFRFRPMQRKGAVPKIEKETPQFYKIGESEESKDSEEDDEKRKKRRKETEERPKVVESFEEEGRKRRRRPEEESEEIKPRFEEESEEIGKRRRRPGREEEEEEEEESRRRRRPGGKDLVLEKIKKFYRIGPDGKRQLIEKPEENESVTLTKKKVFKYGEEERDEPKEEDESEEIKLLKRKKFYRIGPDGKRELVRTEGDAPAEEVEVTKKKVYRIGPDGKRTLVTEPSGKDESEEDEVVKRKIFKIGPEGKRELIREEGEDDQSDDQEEIIMKKKKRFYRIGPNGKRELVRTEADAPEDVTLMKKKNVNRKGADRPVASDRPDQSEEEEVVMKKRRKFYRIGPDGKRELVRTEGDEEPTLLGKKNSTHSPQPLSHDVPDEEEVVMDKKKKFYRVGADGKRELIRTEEEETEKEKRARNDDVSEEVMHKKKRFYTIGPDGKRELVRTEGGETAMEKEKKVQRIGSDGERTLVSGEEEDGEEIVMKKKRNFYRIGPDGKRELVRTEEEKDGEEVLGKEKRAYSPEEEEEVHKEKRLYKIGPNGKRELVGEKENTEPLKEEMTMHKKKRLYKIGADGKRELIRTEGEAADDSEGEVGKKTKRFYKIGKDGKRELIRTEGADEKEKVMDAPKKNLKPTSVVRRGYFKGGPLALYDSGEEEASRRKSKKRLQADASDDDNDDGYEYERGPRKKRTYVLDSHGNRKLVDERTDDESEKNLDLGRLLRPKKTVKEEESISRKHKENHSKTRRMTESSSKKSNSSSSSSVRKVRKTKQRYHRDKHVRASGKSEEEIPDPR